METRREPTPWLWIALIWGSVGLFDATQTVFVMRAEGMHHAWTSLFITSVLSWLPWALATPLVFRLAAKQPAVRWRQFGFWARHSAACAAVGVVYAAWVAMWEELLNPWSVGPVSPFLHLWPQKFFSGLLSFVILYGIIFLVAAMLIFALAWLKLPAEGTS